MPILLLSLLVAALVALLPVWRLRVAGLAPRALGVAWVVYTAAILFIIRFPGAGRFLIPILIVAFLAPFVASPERLGRLLGPRRHEPEPGVVIDVTPLASPALREPGLPDASRPETPRSVEGEVIDDPAGPRP